MYEENASTEKHLLLKPFIHLICNSWVNWHNFTLLLVSLRVSMLHCLILRRNRSCRLIHLNPDLEERSSFVPLLFCNNWLTPYRTSFIRLKNAGAFIICFAYVRIYDLLGQYYHSRGVCLVSETCGRSDVQHPGTESHLRHIHEGNSWLFYSFWLCHLWPIKVPLRRIPK